MRSIIIGFGLLILSLLILFKISEVNFIQGNVRLEIIVAVASVIFFFIGVFFNRQKTRVDHIETPQVQSPSVRPRNDGYHMINQQLRVCRPTLGTQNAD